MADRVIDNTTQVQKVRVDGMSLEEGLLTYARAILDAYLDPLCLAVVRLVVAEAVQFPDVAQRYHENTLRVQEGFAGYLDSMMQQGLLRPCDPALAARDFTYMCIDGVSFLVIPPPPPGPAREARCQHVVTTFLKGHHP